jgi:Cu/Ag efflux protein CusF
MDKKRIAVGNVQTATRSFRSYDRENKQVTLSREFIDALTQILFDET